MAAGDLEGLGGEAEGPVGRLGRSALGTKLWRVRRRVLNKLSDPELRQLATLQRAYDGDDPPEVLVFGDSTMFWTSPRDTDGRRLIDMLEAELPEGVRCHEVLGPAYSPRIVLAYLEAVAHCSGRPKVIVVPISIIMGSATWLAHPKLGYVRTSAAIRDAVATGRRPRKLEPIPPEEFEAYDKRPAPSLVGEGRTVGELRLIVGSRPETKWQGALRLRHLMDLHHGERLEPDGTGVQMVRELGSRLKELGVRAVGYGSPANHEIGTAVLGQKLIEHTKHNDQVIRDAFESGVGDRGVVVAPVLDFSKEEFGDPIHLGDKGRLRFAAMLAEAICAQMSLMPDPEG